MQVMECDFGNNKSSDMIAEHNGAIIYAVILCLCMNNLAFLWFRPLTLFIISSGRGLSHLYIRLAP